MPKARYDKTKKEAIFQSVADARKAGLPWKSAHNAAKKAGYKSSLGGLVQLVRNSKRFGNKRGRKKSSLEAKPTTVMKTTPSRTGVIASLVENLISDRVNAAIERAVAVLQDAIGK